MQSYVGCAKNLVEYEEKNLTFYVDQKTSMLVINNSNSGNLMEQMRHTIENLRNPFTDLYH